MPLFRQGHEAVEIIPVGVMLALFHGVVALGI